MRFITLLVILLSLPLVFAAPHTQYNSFSSAEGRLSLDDSSLSFVDDAVYRTAYYSINGAYWVPFLLSGTSYTGSTTWLTGAATHTLPSALLGSGEHYVLIYSCSRAGTSWDCHSCSDNELGFWQLHVINRASPNELSVYAWVNASSAEKVGKIIVKPTDSFTDPWEVYALDVKDGNVRFILSEAETGTWHALAAPLLTGVEHFVAGTYDGQTMKLYVNSSLAASEDVVIAVGSSSQEILIGKYPTCCALNGTIRDATILQHALSSFEIANLYDAATQPSCSDDVQNGDETGVDCGGKCNPCIVTGDICVAGCPNNCSCGNDEYCHQGMCLLDIPGETYFVAPDGKDTNPGTYEQPWRTWGKAFNAQVINSGDIVYFRGGVYYKNLSEGDDYWYYPRRSSGGGYRISRGGTAGNYVRYWAYPGEIPILDGSKVEPYPAPNYMNYGIRGGAPYTHFKGLHVRNFYQTDAYITEVAGWLIGGEDLIMENCVTYNCGGSCFKISASTNTRIINSDAYNCSDPLGDNGEQCGNDGYGFSIRSPRNNKTNTYLYGCRAWNNGDDGFTSYNIGYVEYDNCWSFDNGQKQRDGCKYPGAGNGYKLAFYYEDPAPLMRTIKNSLAVNNQASGITTNDNDGRAVSAHVYNNLIYHNGYRDWWPYPTYGLIIYGTAESEELERKRVYRNNIVYENEDGPINIAAQSGDASFTHSHNSWELSVTVTDEDFISLDMSQLYRPRKPDGSLPDLGDYFQLAEGSDLIDAGMIIEGYHCDTAGEHPGQECVEWYGNAPDLGPFEYKG